MVKAVAEEPQLELETPSRLGSPLGRSVGSGGRTVTPPTSTVTPPPSATASAVLDYGVVVGGNSSSMQLRLANRGLGYLPLSLSITAEVHAWVDSNLCT